MMVLGAPLGIVGRMDDDTQAKGARGELIAERWLHMHGWTIVQRRFRNGHRDIDLIVEKDSTVAFVEVKARSGATFGDPVQAVNWRKQRELSRSAHVWISRHGRVGEHYRFDVVGVLLSRSGIRVKHVENAFPLFHTAC